MQIARHRWYAPRSNYVEGAVRVSEASAGHVIFVDGDGNRRCQRASAFRERYRVASGAEIDATLARWCE
ncbi:hypothetical protein [Azospirillum halopraeferens]|uniref:hypothetical protein n=1 Tax=Azospirillum halopraeferens TaxID=34010 RepID=UPI0004198A70|nr:hypothetical protein [Azospirillum halopraeferens]